MSQIQTLVAVFDGTLMKAFSLDGGRLHAHADLAMDDHKHEHRAQDDESHAPESVSEHGFVGQVAKHLDAKAGAFGRIIIAADASSLGAFRGAASPGLKSKVVAEIPHDYVHTPVADIEAAVAKHMAG